MKLLEISCANFQKFLRPRDTHSDWEKVIAEMETCPDKIPVDESEHKFFIQLYAS